MGDTRLSAQQRSPVLVINLKRSAARWDHVLAAYSNAGFLVERLDAIDGRAMSEAEVDRVFDGGANRRLYKRPLTRGEIGCHLSHRAAWRRIADGTAAGGYVVEDDTVPTGRLAEAMALIEARSPDWDVIKLFSSRTPPHAATGGRLTLRRRKVLPAGSVAYAVSRPGARKLLACKGRFFRPLDMDLKHWWEKDLRILVICPSVIGLATCHSALSSIEPERGGFRRDPLTRFARNIRYQLRFRLGLLRHLSAGRHGEDAP